MDDTTADALCAAFGGDFTISRLTEHFSAIPYLALYTVSVQSARSHDPNGLYLLQVYKTAEPDTLIRSIHRAERLPTHKTMPTLVLDPVQHAGYVGLLSTIDGINRVKPFTERLSDPNADITALHRVITDLSDVMRAWNPARDLRITSQPGYRWLQNLTPFSGFITGTESILVGERVLRHPVIFALHETSWRGAMPVLLQMGIVHGRLDVAHIYLSDRPFLVDVRGIEDEQPALLDWATLELTTLLDFINPSDRGNRTAWVSLCETLCESIIPTHKPVRGAVLAADLILPLRQAIDAYMHEMPPSLGEWIELGFWFCATTAALRLLATPTLDDATYNAVLIYAACAFERVAKALSLPLPQGQTDLLVQTKGANLGRLHIDARSRLPLINAYALIIGVNQQLDPQINTLKAAGNDSQAITEFLKTNARYPSDHVKTLSDEDANAASIEAGFEWLYTMTAPTRDPDATGFIYYSGHGWQIYDGTYYLIPWETNSGNIRGTAIPIEVFNEWLMDVRAKHLIAILDCCHAGSGTITKGEGSVIAKAPDSGWLSSITSGGRVLITSSTDTQKSHILKNHDNSLFTEVLLESLAQPGTLDALAVFAVLREEVSRRAAQAGVEQTPRMNAANYGNITLIVNQ